VTGGPWRAIPDDPDREHRRKVADGVTLCVFEAGDGGWWWQAQVSLKRAQPEGHEETLNAAMKAADLWASENGYPAVRVEVDP
jgi:hypothetical protein